MGGTVWGKLVLLRSILPKNTCRLSEKKFMSRRAVSLAWINTWSQIIPNINFVRTIMWRPLPCFGALPLQGTDANR
ncbi:hypothetical protein [Pseudomonas sp. H2_C01]